MTLLSIETTDSIVESIIPNLKTLSASSVDSFLKKIISDVTDIAISIVIAIVVVYIGKFLTVRNWIMSMQLVSHIVYIYKLCCNSGAKCIIAANTVSQIVTLWNCK